MYITWKPTYSVGISEIDEQHKRFVVLINDLYDAVEIGSEEIVMGDIIGQLAAYADYHFSTEEMYFDRFNYEKSSEHKKAHQVFRKKIEIFKNKYQGNEHTIAKEVMVFMKDWISKHIQEIDKAYMECFKENGLS